MANSSDEFSQAISEEVTCPVCLEELKEPKILLCSHNICIECLERMPRNKNLNKMDIVCPVCRKPTPIPKGGLRCLPTNAAIVRVVEATLARKAKIEMKESLATGKPMVELLARKISDFDKPLGVLKEIHEKADKLVDVIRDQEASLCREVEEYYDINSETIDEEKSDLDKLHSSASKSVQEAETILKQTLSDSTKTIGVAKVLKEQIKEITELHLSQNTSRENLEFESSANISSTFENEMFGKLTKNTVLNTNYAALDDLCRKLRTLAPNTITTAAPYSSSSETQSKMTTRSQTRKTAANTSKVMSKPLRGTSKTAQKITERYSEENCIVCGSKATHHCPMCKKRSCKSCTTVVTRLPCESYKKHILVEGSPSTNNERADQGFKDVCSFCGVSAASHDCIYCSKKSCSTCRTVYTKDTCVLSKTPHYFVNQQQSTSEKPKISSQTTLSSKDKKPNPFPYGTGETYCDFCGMAANLICKPCLKTICSTCNYAYEQDLCPPTKREHQFEDINEQSSNANETPGNDSSSMWSCERCTFLNSSTHRICAMCATLRGVNQVAMPKSGSRKCQNCTYPNEGRATVCKMCSRTVGLDNPESYI